MEKERERKRDGDARRWGVTVEEIQARVKKLSDGFNSIRARAKLTPINFDPKKTKTDEL